MIEFNKDALIDNIEFFSKEKKLAFVLLIIDRMIPALDKFSLDIIFRSYIYKYCMNIIWSYFDNTTKINQFAKLAAECFDGAPDTEKFDHPLTSAALNAALSIGAAMSFLADDDIDHIVEAAILGIDTMALFAQNSEASFNISLPFKQVMGHPLVQQELQRQQEDLIFLKSLLVENSLELSLLVKERAKQARALLPPDNY